MGSFSGCKKVSPPPSGLAKSGGTFLGVNLRLISGVNLRLILGSIFGVNFQSYPPAKLQISQNGISRQESFLSPIGSPWEFWTNRSHQSASFFGARLFGRKIYLDLAWRENATNANFSILISYMWRETL